MFARFVFLLWVAFLAFGVPEIIAGSGKMWITNPGTYIMVIPIYALHFLLFVHIAVRTGRTSWPALYLFGVLFGLYESWITKVVWKGYPGAGGFSFGSFGQWFGAHETLGLVLFYHAVISFLLPLAVVSRLFPAFGQHFPVPDWVFGNSRWALLRRLGLLFILGIVTGHNNPVMVEFLITWVPWLVLIWVGYLYLRRLGVTSQSAEDLRSVARPVLGRIGFVVAALWLAAIYVVAYIYILPESRPPLYVQMITLGFYPVLFFLIRRAGRAGVHEFGRSIASPGRLPFGWLIGVFAVGLLGNIVNGYGIGIRGGMAIVAFLSMIPIGVVLFGWLVGWKVVARRG